MNVHQAVFTNILDLPILSMSDRLAGYKKILSRPRQPLLDLVVIERVMFSKILALSSNNNLEIIPFEVRLKPIAADLLPCLLYTSPSPRDRG